MNQEAPTVSLPPAPQGAWRPNLTFVVVMSAVVYVVAQLFTHLMEQGVTENNHRGPYATAIYEVGVGVGTTFAHLAFTVAIVAVAALAVTVLWDQLKPQAVTYLQHRNVPPHQIALILGVARTTIIGLGSLIFTHLMEQKLPTISPASTAAFNQISVWAGTALTYLMFTVATISIVVLAVDYARSALTCHPNPPQREGAESS